MAKRPCAGMCGALVVKGYCPRCMKRRSPAAVTEAKRPSAAKRGYGRQWQKDRLAYFRLHPFCADPYGLHGEHVEMATELDHIVPHKGDEEKFNDTLNRQGLCKGCHSRKTSTEDGGWGRVKSLQGLRL